MKKIILFTLLHLFSISLIAQTNKEKALELGKEAIKIMDEGKIDESIKLLEQGKKLDTENYIYPYEIAYAHTLREEYEEAIKILEKLKKYKSINNQVFQMSGNCYDYLGNPNQAMKEYDEGLKMFPNSGNLYLEKGNIFVYQEKYDEAIQNFEKGIKVEPEFPSNYYRLAKLFLNSNDKLSGLIYGELFLNLERTTDRSLEMSKLLYDTYKSSIIFNENEIKFDFCEIFVDASLIQEDGKISLPLCAIFGKNIGMAVSEENQFNLNTLSSMRINFINYFFKEDYKKYPNVLFEYHKKMLDNNVFEAYNHYLFQIGAEKEFKNWVNTNKIKYNEFLEWYTKDENILSISNSNIFLR